MPVRTFLAVFEPTKMGYSVCVPDLPGCVTTGARLTTRSTRLRMP